MLRSIIFGFIISIITLTSGAQTLKQVDGGFEAMLPLLEKAGYKVYSFDLTPLSDSTYQIQFIIRRYVDGELENENAMPYTIQSRTMLSQFSEEARAEVTPEQMADAEKGIYSLSPRIDIGFMPAVDSLCNVMLNVVNQGSITMPLKLKELTNRKENEKSRYSYEFRPFKSSEFRTGEFIPLVLFGSMWWDERANVHRFCGANEIDRDMSTDILKYIPHYYVIGIKVSK